MVAAVTATTLFASVCWAKPSAAASQRPQHVNLRTHGPSLTREMGSESWQNLVLAIYLVSGHLIHQKAERDLLANREQSFSRPETIGETIDLLINDVGFWLNVAGSALGSYAGLRAIISASGDSNTANNPINSVSSTASESGLPTKVKQQLSSALRAGLRTGVIASLAFLGGPILARLWTESIHLETGNPETDLNPDEIRIAESSIFLTTLFNALVKANDRGYDVTAEDQQRHQILGKIVANLATILAWNPEARNNWLYNTFRLDYGTGEFVVPLGLTLVVPGVVGSATTAGFQSLRTASYITVSALRGAVATAAIPAPHPITKGLITTLGVVSGIGSTIWAIESVPQSWKDDVTDSIRRERVSAASRRASANLLRLIALYNKPRHPDQRMLMLERLLEDRMIARNYAITAQMERVYSPHSAMLRQLLDLAEFHRAKVRGKAMSPESIAAATERNKLVDQLFADVQSRTDGLVNYYDQEVKVFNELLSGPAVKWTDDEKQLIRLNSEFLEKLKQEMTAMKFALSRRIDPESLAFTKDDKGAMQRMDSEAHRRLNYAYLFGFDETAYQVSVQSKVSERTQQGAQ